MLSKDINLTKNLFLQVGITCVTEDDIECNQFFVPTLQCDTDLSDVTFRYTGGDCNSENNQQPDSFCIDVDDLPGDADVLVTCFDDTEVLSQETVSPGDEFGVSGTPLPDTLNCVVTTPDEDFVYQDVTFSLVNGFTLKSSFGSLLVEQCGELDCVVDVTYTYTTTNVGTEDLDITAFLRTRNDETVDLIDSVDPTDIAAGESTVTEEDDVVDYCVASSINTEIDVVSEGEDCVVNEGRSGNLRSSGGSSGSGYAIDVLPVP